MKTLRRYELLLPIRFNDGTPVPASWLGEAVKQFVDRFGAASYETQTVKGRWRQAGETERDDLNKLVVDVPDSDENRRGLLEFKESWRRRLGQDELWLVSYAIEVD